MGLFSRIFLLCVISPALAFANAAGVRSVSKTGNNGPVVPVIQGDGSGATQQPVAPKASADWLESVKTYNTPVSTVAPVTMADSGSDGGAASGVLIAGVIGACAALFGANGLGGNNESNLSASTKGLYDYVDEAGFQDYDDYQPDAEMGAAVNARLGGTCEQKFIDQSGRLGGWGKHVLDEVRTAASSYANYVPEDMNLLCPNYEKFDQATREKYWVWNFMSLASPESSCRAEARNPNAPNGTAKGLYQLEKPACDRVGVAGDLYDPHVNIRCAVRLLGAEISCRGTVTSPTSRGRCGTYWGPLRTDDETKARGGDIPAAQKYRALASQFHGCK